MALPLRQAGEMGYIRPLLRSFRAAPGLTFAAILILSLSIGGATSLFTVVRSAIAETVPFPSSERLVHIYQAGPTETRGNAGYQTWLDWRERVQSFSHMAAVTLRSYPLTSGGDAEQIAALRVTHEFFDLLGVQPLYGRDFTAEDDTPDRRHVVILSHGLWQRRFGGDSSVVGRLLTFGGAQFEVIGILPADFHPVVSTGQYAPAEAWMPLGYDPSQPWACRSCGHLRTIGRVADGFTIEEATAELSTIQATLREENPGAYPEDERILLTRFQDVYVGETARRAFTMIGVALALLVLAAVATLSIMILLRIVSRSRSLAIRAVVGATPKHLRRELIAETLMIGLCGGIGAVAIAFTLNGLATARFRQLLPTLQSPRVDLFSIGFGIAVATLLGIVIGSAAVQYLGRISVLGSLTPGNRSMSVSRSRTRAHANLVIVTLAAGTLLIAAVLMTGRSLAILTERDPGFDRENVLTFRISPAGDDYDEDEEIISFHERLLNRFRQMPGVIDASLTSQLPLGGSGDRVGFAVEGVSGAEAPEVQRYVVDEHYFRTMKIGIVTGRSFDPRDHAGGEPVVIVGETTARRLWPDDDPIGQLVRTGGESADPPMRRVIGIARDVRHHALGEDPGMQAYFPFRQLPLTWGVIVLRTEAEPLTFLDEVRSVAAELDPRLPLFDAKSFEEIVMTTEATRRVVLEILIILAAITLIIAGASVYGVLSHVVARSWKEIGIRQAIGEMRSESFWRIIQRALGYSAAAMALGLGIILMAGAPMQPILFEVSPRDPVSLSIAGLLTMLLGIGAAAIPAWRAARIDPMTALRQE